MRKLAVSLLATLAVGLWAIPASATHGGPHPTFKEGGYFFHCAADDKVQNLDYPSPFDSTAPDKSAQDGAGCGFADPGALINTMSTGGPADASFEGQITGNITNMTVQMYLLGYTNYSAVLAGNVDVWLTIDGEEYIASGTQVTDVPWTEQNSGVTHMIEFTIKDIGYAQNVYDAQGNVIDVQYGGVATENGDGTATHDVDLTIGMHFSDENGIWAWDTTEVPSGITVNDPTPASKSISAGKVPPE